MVLVRSALMWPRVAIVIGLLAGVATAAVLLGDPRLRPGPAADPDAGADVRAHRPDTDPDAHARAEHLPATVRAGSQPIRAAGRRRGPVEVGTPRVGAS